MEERLFLAPGNGLFIEEAHHFVVLVHQQLQLPVVLCAKISQNSSIVSISATSQMFPVQDVRFGFILGFAVSLVTMLPVLVRSLQNGFPHLAQPRAQMTQRLREVLCLLGFATCAEKAARLAPQLGMKGSASTVLRCQRATPLAEPEPFTKIGLDDFAFRRGRTLWDYRRESENAYAD